MSQSRPDKEKLRDLREIRRIFEVAGQALEKAIAGAEDSIVEKVMRALRQHVEVGQGRAGLDRTTIKYNYPVNFDFKSHSWFSRVLDGFKVREQRTTLIEAIGTVKDVWVLDGLTDRTIWVKNKSRYSIVLSKFEASTLTESDPDERAAYMASKIRPFELMDSNGSVPWVEMKLGAVRIRVALFFKCLPLLADESDGTASFRLKVGFHIAGSDAGLDRVPADLRDKFWDTLTEELTDRLRVVRRKRSNKKTAMNRPVTGTEDSVLVEAGSKGSIFDNGSLAPAHSPGRFSYISSNKTLFDHSKKILSFKKHGAPWLVFDRIASHGTRPCPKKELQDIFQFKYAPRQRAEDPGSKEKFAESKLQDFVEVTLKDLRRLFRDNLVEIKIVLVSGGYQLSPQVHLRGD